MAESGERSHPAGTGRGRRAPKRVVVVCVPGGGGPNLADHLRAAHGPGGLSVHLVVVAGDPPPPLLVGDPMSGVFWPCERRPDDEAPAAEAARRARQCQWFLWEMGLRSTIEMRRGDPGTFAVEAGLDPSTDSLVLALPAGRRWRHLARTVAARLAGAGVEVRAAHDRRVDRLTALVPVVAAAVR